VFERKQIALSIGDRIRFTKNVKRRGQKFFNNELWNVIGIDEGRIIFDKGEMLRNGSALHIDQGIAVMSRCTKLGDWRALSFEGVSSFSTIFH